MTFKKIDSGFKLDFTTPPKDRKTELGYLFDAPQFFKDSTTHICWDAAWNLTHSETQKLKAAFPRVTHVIQGINQYSIDDFMKNLFNKGVSQTIDLLNNSD